MDIRIGSRWLNKTAVGVSVVIEGKDHNGNLLIAVSTPITQYQGFIDPPGLLHLYFPEDDFIVDRIMEKYGY